MEFTRSVPVRLKYLLVSLVLLVSQSLLVATASAHEIDPGHAGDDCSVCLTVSVNDDGPSGPAIRLDCPDAPVWQVRPVAASAAISAACQRLVHARAPPL